MSDESHGWEFFTGFLLGTVVGAAAALLLAPQSGEETREVIRERGIELQGRMGQTTEEARERATELAGEARSRATDLAGEARTRATEAQERSRTLLEEQKSRLQEAIDQGKEAAQQKREELTARFQSEKSKEEPSA